MIKKIVLAVTACLLIFLTYSCTKIDYGVNLPKEYKEFFDHTFGWYKVELINKTIHYNSEEGKYGSRKWKITYSCKSKGVNSFVITSSKFFPDKGISDEKAFNNLYIRDICLKQIEENVKYEMAYEIMPKVFADYGMTPYNEMVCGENGCRIEMNVNPNQNLCYGSLSSNSSISLYETDLTYAACSEKYEIQFKVYIDRNLEDKVYIEKIEEIFDKFQKYTKNPKKYDFSLYYDTDFYHNEKELIYTISDNKESENESN